MLVRLTVNVDTCVGSADCAALDPEAIELDERGSAVVTVAELDEDRARALCDECPTGSLSISG